MRHTMVTPTVEPGRGEENAALVRAVFEELSETRPAGFRFAALGLPDQRRFVHLCTDQGAPTGVEAPSSFTASLAAAEDRHERPASVTRPEPIGDPRTLGTATEGEPAPERPASTATSRSVAS